MSEELATHQRVVAASAASLLASVIVNPLDVVKARVQAQVARAAAEAMAPLPVPAAAAAAAPGASAPSLRTAAASHAAAQQQWWRRPPAAPQAACSTPKGSFNAITTPRPSSLAALRTILRREGAAALWRGSNLGMIMQVPLIGIYLPLYDWLRPRLPQDHPLSPMAAAVAARAAAVLATSPLEFVRVRVQAAEATTEAVEAARRRCHRTASDTSSSSSSSGGGDGGGTRAGSGSSASSSGSSGSASGSSSSSGSSGGGSAMRRAAADVFREAAARPGGWARRASFLWTGCGASLAKDLPFAAIYFSLLEPMRMLLLPPPQPPIHSAADPSTTNTSGGNGLAGIAAANAAAAATASCVAAVVTQPMDVAKTKLQVLGATAPCGSRLTLLPALRALYARGGVGALLSGLGPRVVRTAAAYGVVMSSYEIAKALAAARNQTIGVA